MTETDREFADDDRSTADSRAALQARLSAIIDSSDDGIVSKDLNGIVQTWNDAAARMFGYTAEEMVGRPITTLIPPGRQHEEQEILDRVRRGQRVDHFETVRVRKDGRMIPVSVTVSPVRDADGRVVAASKIVRDLSATSELEGRFKAIVDSSDDAIVSKNLNGVVQSWNPGAERIFGYKPAEMIGRPIEVLFPPDRRDEEPKILARLRRGERVDHFETVRVRKDGQLIDVSVTISPVRSPTGEIIGASKIARDVTAQKRALRDLEAARLAAEQARAEAETLVEIGRTVSGQLELNSIVQAVTDAATAMTGAAFGAFFYNVPDPAGGHYTLYTISGVPREAFSKFPMPRATDLFGPTFRGEAVVRLDDVLADPRYGRHAPYHGMPQGHLPVRSYLAVSVRSRAGEVVGGLFFGHPDVARFTDRHERLLEGVAAQAAIAVDNARLYDAVRSSSESAERSLAQLRAVVGVMAEGLVLADADGNLLQWNPAALEMHGYAATGDVHKHLNNFPAVVEVRAGGRLVPFEQWPMSRVLRGETFTKYELVVERLDVSFRRVISYSGGAVRDRDGKVTLAVLTLHDVTDERAVQADRDRLLESERAARADAERASRTKDEFLATLSHELRTPLNAILGWAQILHGPNPAPDDLREGVEVIERNARTQAQIVDDLLDMSRIISGKLRMDVQRVDLAAVVRASVATARPAADAKSIRLQVVLDPHAGPVSGDPSRLQQVFWNLLTNAVKFTPRGGRVQVLLERVNSHLEVSVSDTGEGIEPRFLPHVFDRFRQADATTTRRHGGLGLGLSIVKQLVELHGGMIRAKSGGLGQGSTFTVELPVAPLRPQEDGEPERQHPRTGHAPIPLTADVCDQVAGVRVLVVDDEPDARALVRRLLEDCGVIVETAASAQEAVVLLGTVRPDVLISDIGMPGEDGYSLIRRVRALGAGAGGDVPALALTAYARAEDRMKAMLAGFQQHVAKPVEPAELVTLVAVLAAGRRRNGG